MHDQNQTHATPTDDEGETWVAPRVWIQGGPILDQIRSLLEDLAGPSGTSRSGQIIPVVPQGDGRQTIPAGQNFVFELSSVPRLKALVVDIPTEMDATILLDGNEILGVNDGQGSSGELEFPTAQGRNADTIEIHGQNNATDPQDVRLWARVIYEFQTP